MTKFVPGSPDDVAWCILFAAVVAHGNLAPSDEKCAIYADRMMAERAKRLTTQHQDKPKWRCGTCEYAHVQTNGSFWCIKNQWGHDLKDWGCSDWEQKQEPPAP